MKSLTAIALITGTVMPCLSCEDFEGPPDQDIVPVIKNVVMDPSVTCQEMTGFGGSLTWYAERITASLHNWNDVPDNLHDEEMRFDFDEVAGRTVKSQRAVQTDAVSFYREIREVSADKYYVLKPKSITTIVVELF